MAPESVITSTPPHPWASDQYLVPVLQDDPLLQLDFENDGGGGGGSGGGGGANSASGGGDGSNEYHLKAKQVPHFFSKVHELFCGTG